MDEKKAWVLYPEYFDSARTRASGRKVKKELAVPDPTVEMIEKAVQKLAQGDVFFVVEGIVNAHGFLPSA